MDSVSTALRNLKVGVLAGLAAMIVPAFWGVWEIYNEPFILPNGQIDDAAERGAGMFLLFMIWPISAISIVYHWALASAITNRKSSRIRSLLFTSVLMCGLVSVVVASTFYELGIGEQLRAFAILFPLAALCALPGIGVIAYEIKNA